MADDETPKVKVADDDAEVVAKPLGPPPKWYTQDDAMAATIDLSDLGFGKYAIADSTWAEAHAIGKEKNDRKQSVMTIKAYCGPGTDSGEGNPAWPVEKADLGAWDQFVGSLRLRIVQRISSGIGYYIASGNQDDDSGN